jgi:UDP-N-acetylmuramyl pentapeptide phosphotransferase/UDP-N-acetylglucosamine-1-phosphate transferase
VPTPRGGGWACIAGILGGAITSATRGVGVPWFALAAALALGLVGFLDDRRGLPASLRLMTQVLAGAVAGAALGGVAGALVGVLLYPVAVNVVNFMDGINGITALTVALWGATALLIGHRHDLSDLELVGALCAGSALGFLPWNAPTSRLFLGDVGSYLFGALAAGGILLGWLGDAPLAVLVAPWSVYLADTTATLVGRARRGEPVLEAHRSHVYQRLTTGPHPLPHVAVAIYTVGLAAGVTVGWAILPIGPAAILTIALLTLYLASPWLRDRRATTPDTSTEAV